MRSAAVRSVLLVATSAVALTACAQGTGATGESGGEDVAYDPDAELTGEMSVMGFGLVDEVAEVRHDLALEELGDGVDVSLVEGDLDIQQFLSAVAAGDPPGLVYANRDQIGTFASRGAIVPLDACVEGEGIDTSVFRETALEQVTFDGALYALPEFMQVQITMANGDLLEAAGLSVDDVNGSDWEAVTAATTALTQGSGGDLSVIGYDSKLPEFLPLWAKANGADLLSDDARSANLDDPKVVEALEFAVEVYDQQGGFGGVKAYRDAADFFGEGNQFATGVLGAMPMENWYVNVLNEVSADAPMVFDTFRGRDGEALAYSGGSAWAIPAGTEETQAAACRFIRVITATDSWLAAAQERADQRAESGQLFTGLLTGNAEADEQIRSELVPTDAPEPWASAVAAIYEANDHAVNLPANPADAEFKAAWQDAVNRVLNGQAEPAEALAQAQAEAQEALDEAWAEWDEDQG
ncbi:extracellular solute-binding protein [Actinotalea sp. JY-7885]|uniref:extracellular solute-binding protein n=1 Tax=Actinotalea sp. JY-7885 TaxID=2758576 RepID=UPI00165EAE3F|nr:extracellular solute-binding protein [Actinotalea sp. JY-7885]